MRALMYLTRRSLVNNLKKAVQKPSTLIALIFAIGYGIFIVVSLGSLAVSIRLDSVRGLLIIITAWSIYATLGNFMAYSSRKGILFKPAHAHFVFTAPISPKVVLLNSAWMNYVMSVVGGAPELGVDELRDVRGTVGRPCHRRTDCIPGGTVESAFAHPRRRRDGTGFGSFGHGVPVYE